MDSADICKHNNVTCRKCVDEYEERVAALQKEVKEGDEYGEEANTERSELKCEVYTLREAISTQAKHIAALEAENREAVAVLALLRLHRTGRDWDKPIPGHLLSREHNAIGDYRAALGEVDRG